MIFCAALVIFASCSEEGENLRPGLWTTQDVIETFPGDTALVQGQVSNYVGLRSVEIVCEAWGIEKKYELQGKHCKVFNFNYQMPVPEDADFDSELKITVTDVNGTENKKVVVLTFLPDTDAPTVTGDMPSQVAVDFDAEEGKGVFNLSLDIEDDRALKSAIVEIADIAYTKSLDVKGRSAQLTDAITLAQTGVFQMNVILTDASGNQSTYTQELVVMVPEVEDPISDYPFVWMVNAEENEDDYLDGYYIPMTRSDAYQYSGNFYADHDGYQLYIVPEKTMEGDVFGASPYVSSKLMNKRGYVVPLVIEKAGYYGLWIDISTNTWSIWNLDTSEAYTGTLTISGCGFKDFGDWGVASEPMQRNGFRYTGTLTQNGSYTGTRYYYAADTSTWGYVLRFWSDATYGCGWWEDTEGGGGSVGSYVSDYDGPVTILFDTATLWATVKKSE